MEVQTNISERFYVGEDEYEIAATVTAQAERDDYGVPGSPTWTSYYDLAISWPIHVGEAALSADEFTAFFGAEAERIEAEILETAYEADSFTPTYEPSDD